MKNKDKKFKIVFTDSFNKSLEKLISNNPMYLIPRVLNDIKYETKWFFQRLLKGYDDMEIIDFYSFANKYLRKRFKAFATAVRTYREGCPTCFYEYGDDGNAKYNEEEAMKRWLEVLARIEMAFDLMHEEEIGSDRWLKKSNEQLLEDSKVIDEGLNLFGKYYRCFWL
jgi:hypothetical protein